MDDDLILELDDDTFEELQRRAKLAGLEPEELARQLLTESVRAALEEKPSSTP